MSGVTRRRRTWGTESWSVEIPKDIPRQMNGCDCGVFMLKYADYIAVGCPLTFHQRDMEYFRRRIVADADGEGQLMDGS
jgi:sentrin-specific protease 1